MKKVILNSLIIAALALTAAFTSCKSKKSSDVKLLERMIIDNGTEWRFEYNDKNQIVKIDEYKKRELYKTETITYNSNNITVERKDIKHPHPDSYIFTTIFVIKDQTITFHDGDYMMTITDNGYIDEEFGRMDDGGDWYSTMVYEYKNGKMTSQTITPGYIFSFEYDDKMSPFRNVASPKWLLQQIFNRHVTFENNITKRNDEGLPWYESTVETSQYEYDSNGFPTKRISKIEYQDDPDADQTKFKYTTTHYIYRGEKEKHIAYNEVNNDTDVDINHESSDDDDSYSEAEAFTIYFNDDEIAVYGFRSPNSDGELELDSMTFYYDGLKQTLRFYGTEKVTSYIPGRGYYPAAGDYNFDGYMDIIIESETGGDNMYYDVYLYDPNRKRYFHHKELSDMTGIQADKETRTIRMYSVGDVEGQTYSMYIYSWMGDELELLYKEDRNFDFDIEKYILIIQTLQDGEWVVLKTDTISAGDLWN